MTAVPARPMVTDSGTPANMRSAKTPKSSQSITPLPAQHSIRRTTISSDMSGSQIEYHHCGTPSEGEVTSKS